jgi:hypothetical protein
MMGFLRFERQADFWAGMDAFSPDYFTARERFRAAAQAAGARLEAHPIAARGPAGEALSIDVAVLGDAGASRALVVSSGLHGVEGFAGSAVQLAWLGSLAGRPAPPGVRLVLIHALNPYGFAWRRRANEHNVDLNRNGLAEGEAYAGAPPEVGLLADFIAPASPPDPPWLAWRYWPQAALIVARHGLDALRGALTQGQYDHPEGLFYGGAAPEETTRILRSRFAGWTGEARFVLHLDLHTGLGPAGACTLLPGAAPEHLRWLAAHLSGQRLEPAHAGLNTTVRGALGDDLHRRLGAAGRDHVFATVEFGTSGPLAAFRALREENRAHRFPRHPGCEPAKRRLVECFCPGAERWRERRLQRGVALCGQALLACASLDV